MTNRENPIHRIEKLPRIRIQIKMIWIRNTAIKLCLRKYEYISMVSFVVICGFPTKVTWAFLTSKSYF